MEDFESSPEFQALVVAAAGKPERSMGDSVIPAEPPQWKDVDRLASDLLKQAPAQMPVHIYKIQAETHIKGFAGFQSSLQALQTLLTEQWDAMFPEPDLDDPDDMYYARVNLMRELSEQPAFADALYRRPLVSARGIGEFSARDIDICNGTVSGSDEEQERCQDGLIRGAFTESDRDALQSMADALSASTNLLTGIETLFDDKTGESGAVSLKSLKDKVELCRARFFDYAADYLDSDDGSAESVEAGETVSNGAEETAAAPTVLQSSSLSGRDAVMVSFDRLLQYYQVNEPSSPVRLLTSRAREFVGLTFFEVLQALAPKHQDNLQELLVQLEKQPLAYLLNDTYGRFLSGNLSLDVPATASAGEDAGLGNNHSNAVIGSRDEVVEILQDIETYFAVNEPASPLPLILSDIRKLVNKRFTELVADFRRSLPVEAEEPSD